MRRRKTVAAKATSPSRLSQYPTDVQALIMSFARISYLLELLRLDQAERVEKARTSSPKSA